MARHMNQSLPEGHISQRELRLIDIFFFLSPKEV